MAGGQKIVDGLHEALGWGNGAAAERDAIVRWLRGELTTVPRVGPDRAYRMGQADAIKLAIDAIERGAHLERSS